MNSIYWVNNDIMCDFSMSKISVKSNLNALIFSTEDSFW